MTQARFDLIGVEDAGELLTVRRAAFVTEAQLYGDPNLPALTQTIDELIADLERADVVTIGAWIGHRLVGSVRVELSGERASIGRLAVAPDLQGRGIGSDLLMQILRYLPEQTTEVWVFTGKDSRQSLSLQEGSGGVEPMELDGNLTYAYMRRLLGEEEPASDESAVE